MKPLLIPSSERFRRASKYHPEWILAGASGGAQVLWLTEWLTEAVKLKPGMKVLDLGCGRAMSSIFLHREFGVQVWAADLWFDPSENLQRIRDAGAQEGVFPLRADARALPFANEFFDAILSIDSFVYYGTEDHYLHYLSRLLKPGGQLGIAQVGLTHEVGDPLPDHLRDWWKQDQLWSFHTAAWWKHHWNRTGVVEVEVADVLSEGWSYWVEWLRTVAPHNTQEITALETDVGRHLGYTRIVGRRNPGVELPDPIQSIPPNYVKKPLLRNAGPSL